MKKFDFNSLSKRELSEREMNSLSGGNVCGCGCVSNSNYDNGTANHAGNKSSNLPMDKLTYFLDEVVVVGKRP